MQTAPRLAEAAGRASESAGAGPGPGSSSQGGPEVVDAEFEEVDKRDRKAS
jgi:molecular chaperone DnaK